jgi:mono/diheme cytochrome c family protein
MNRTLLLAIGVTLTAGVGVKCDGDHAPAAPAPAAASAPATSPTAASTLPDLSKDVRTQGSIRSITLPELDPDLPAGEGRNIALIACGTCHTPRYIMHQPPLSRDAWTASVNKMRTTYSAPIAEENVKPIVDYLVAVRGSQQPR